MSQAKVSILIPVHNGEAYVGKAIRSALAQDYHDLEVVVLDDGSSDGSARVARAFGDARIRVYRRDGHEGLAATRNHLLIAARGQYVAWLDADDAAFPERLRKQVDFLERHDDHALVASAYVEIDAHGQTLRQRSLPTTHQELDNRLLQNHGFPCSTVLVRHQAVDDAGGFSEELAQGCEQDLFLRIAEKWRIAALREPLVKCRLHARALSYTRRHEHRDGSDEARRRAVLRRYRKAILLIDGEQDAAEAIDATATTATAAAAAAIESSEASAASEAAAVTDPTTAPRPEPDATTELLAEEATEVELDGASEDAETEVATAAAPDELAGGEATALLAEDGDQDEDGGTGEAEAEVDAADDADGHAEVADEAAEEAAVLADSADEDEDEDEGEDEGESEVTLEDEDSAEVALEQEDQDGAAGDTEEGETATALAALVSAQTTDGDDLEEEDAEATVAVILPVTGRKALEAVRSVLDQSLRDLSLVVVATKADEGLERGLEILGDTRVVLLDAPGAAPARALNLGILATRSRYIAYLSEKSVYRSEHLERLVTLAEGERLGFVYADLGLATKGLAGATVSARDFDSDQLLKENFIPTEGVVHRRDLLREVGLFNEGLDEGMEWELWVYLTRQTAARRLPEATVERVVSGRVRLPRRSPARVRRFLSERFSGRTGREIEPSIQISRDELADESDRVVRAQERFRRGDWAGAAAELVEAAARPFSALSQLFSPPYPEREVPAAELVSAQTPELESRPRERSEQAQQVAAARIGQDTATTRQMLTNAISARAGTAPTSTPGGSQAARMRNEPKRRTPAEAGGSTAAGKDDAPTRNNWLYVQSGMVGTGRSRGSGGRYSATPHASGYLPGTMSRNRRKAMSTLVQNPPCPLCNHDKPAVAHRAGWYRVLDCSACGLAFSHPRLDRNLAARFFSDRRIVAIPPGLRAVEELTGTPFDRSRELGWVGEHVDKGKLIDVGCSWGYAVAQARSLGYDAIGTEMSRTLARAAREKFGVEVHECELSELGLQDSSVDAILAAHVIHHIVEPRAFFTEAARVLRPGGVLVGSLPNFDAHLREHLGRRWSWLDPESQGFHFRPQLLGRELEAASLGAELWTSEGLHGDETLSELVGAEKATELARQGRGSELAFVATKPARFRL